MNEYQKLFKPLLELRACAWFSALCLLFQGLKQQNQPAEGWELMGTVGESPMDCRAPRAVASKELFGWESEEQLTKQPGGLSR